jgi:hypothetical protein
MIFCNCGTKLHQQESVRGDVEEAAGDSTAKFEAAFLQSP